MDRKLLWAFLVLISVVAGFFLLNSYIYNEKQADGAETLQERLISKKWIWQKTLLNDGSEIVPRREGDFTLIFHALDGLFSGSTDCNSFSGEFVLSEDGRANFGSMISTLMYCEGSQEQEFLSFLSNTDSLFITSDGQLILSLKFDSGSVIFR